LLDRAARHRLAPQVFFFHLIVCSSLFSLRPSPPFSHTAESVRIDRKLLFFSHFDLSPLAGFFIPFVFFSLLFEDPEIPFPVVSLSTLFSLGTPRDRGGPPFLVQVVNFLGRAAVARGSPAAGDLPFLSQGLVIPPFLCPRRPQGRFEWRFFFPLPRSQPE